MRGLGLGAALAAESDLGKVLIGRAPAGGGITLFLQQLGGLQAQLLAQVGVVVRRELAGLEVVLQIGERLVDGLPLAAGAGQDVVVGRGWGRRLYGDLGIGPSAGERTRK